jgi:hypothetical protein
MKVGIIIDALTRNLERTATGCKYLNGATDQLIAETYGVSTKLVASIRRGKGEVDAFGLLPSETKTEDGKVKRVFKNKRGDARFAALEKRVRDLEEAFTRKAA